MFNRPTTFVIGAGCSREYQFPLGLGLRDEIADMLKHVEIDRPRGNDSVLWIGFGGSKDADFNRAITNIAGQHQFQEWYRVAQQMGQGLQHASSIDRYLDHHSEDDVMVKIGKMAIGRRIIKAEANSTLRLREGASLDMAEIYKQNGQSPHWLNEIFLRLQEGVRRGNIDQIFSNVTFICFNYDRAIEHYLYQAVKVFGNLSDDDTTAVMKNLKVYHPYGSLGPLPWQDADGGAGIPYGAELNDHRSIQTIGESLRVFTETIEENDEINCIRNAVLNASKLVFVGFSFLQQNIDLIRPHTRSKVEQVWATTFGMSGWDTDAAKNAVSTMLNGTNSMDFVGMTMRTQPLTAGQFMAEAGNELRS